MGGLLGGGGQRVCGPPPKLLPPLFLCLWVLRWSLRIWIPTVKAKWNMFKPRARKKSYFLLELAHCKPETLVKFQSLLHLHKLNRYMLVWLKYFKNWWQILWLSRIFFPKEGWGGMVAVGQWWLGVLLWILVGQGRTVLAVGAGVCCLVGWLFWA